MSSQPSRHPWVDRDDSQLLAECDVDTYRASGPGGQKRNKTSSAVRLRHEPTGMIVIAEESRSQHENKAKALRRLKQALFLKIREPFAEASPEIAAVRTAAGKLEAGRKDPRFWPAVGVILDAIDACNARVSEAAEKLGTTTGNLIDFLQADSKAFEAANVLRQKHGQKPLRADG
jgi:hypothetical protein